MNMENDIVFQEFNSKEDLLKQRALFRECFPENNGTPVESDEHYFWKFHTYPSKKKSFEYIAVSDGEFLGYYAALPYEYLVDKKKITVGMVCDVMTGLKARGKGIFTKLGKYSTEKLKEEGLAFTTGYPIRPEVIPGHLKVGWKIVFYLPLYISFIKTNSLLRSKNIGIISPIINIIINFYRIIIGVNRKVSQRFNVKTYSNKEINQIVNLAGFINEWSKYRRIVLDKRLDFLKWRLNAPGKEYKILVMQENNQIVSLAITRFVIKEDVPSLAILDLMVLNDKSVYSKNMFRAIYKLAVELKAESLLVMSSRTTSKKLKYIKNGLIKSPYKFQLIIKKLNTNMTDEFLYNEKNWSLMWIDSDDL